MVPAKGAVKAPPKEAPPRSTAASTPVAVQRPATVVPSPANPPAVPRTAATSTTAVPAAERAAGSPGYPGAHGAALHPERVWPD